MHVGPMVRRWMGGCNRCMDGDFVIEVARAGFASGRSFYAAITRYTAEPSEVWLAPWGWLTQCNQSSVSPHSVVSKHRVQPVRVQY